MRTSTRPIVLFVLLALAACGDEGPTPVPATTPRGVPSKPMAPVGAVQATVVGRPAPDRALVEVQWERGGLGQRPELELVLPAGAWVVAGPGRRVPMGPERSGVLRYTIAFPPGQVLDATVVLRAETDAGVRASETSVRLSAP